MPVYVDRLFWTTPSKKWRHDCACHMYADTLEELHQLAESIGLKKCWFQNRRGRNFPHYDLTESKREQAVKAGAVEHSRKETVEWYREQK